MRIFTCCALGIVVSAMNLCASAQTPKVVISQIYGGAGCGTANCSTYRNDYIEIFNSGSAAQNLNGWSVQYSSASGTAWQVTNLGNVTLQPGQYYLIAEGAGPNGSIDIPTPDATGTIAMSSVAGKVALVNTTTALSGSCPTDPTIVDFVGYGATASCNEGGANAPAPSTTTADLRVGNGCTDAGNNSTDFTATAPNARNSSTSVAPCTTLPVSFVSFKAQYEAATNSVSISWSTASEQNARAFVVQRSTDGNVWTDVSRVNAAGNTNATSSYQAIDMHPLQGSSLYRIMQVDIDGRSTYTGIIGLRTSGKLLYFRAFPNPTDGTVYINVALTASAPVSIRVSDMNGRVLMNEQRVFDAAQPIKLDLLRFGKGVYSVAVVSGDYTGMEKVVVY